ncbi:MAG: ROK family protein [Bacteroidales bacterium]|nr:ROK family protein [Bacteroidales bacterium]
MEKKFVVGVDVGGQTSKLGIVNKDGNVVAQSVIRTDQTAVAEEFLSTLAKAIKDLLAGSKLSLEDINGVGIGAPNGNYYSGCIDDAPNVAWANGVKVPVAEILSGKLDGVKVTLTNDANAAALGEMQYGIAKGIKNFIMITLGTGVGSGIVIDGKLLYGADGFAGELGHTCVDNSPNARTCGCGLKGCLEAYCSAIGAAKTAKLWLIETTEPSSLRSLPLDQINSYEVYKAAKAGDALALKVFDYTGTILGTALADFVKFSAPEAIVLFGGLARSKEFLTEPITKAMNAHLLSIWKGKIKLLYSSLPESDAAILGASALAW